MLPELFLAELVGRDGSVDPQCGQITALKETGRPIETRPVKLRLELF
jgi:hypothetical protein